jgi:hypothetical protein
MSETITKLERIEVPGGTLFYNPVRDVYHVYTATGDHYLGVFKNRREAEYEVERAEAREAGRVS